MTQEITQETLSQIVGRVAGALEAAVKDYGPDAVDLALLAYRVDAIQSLVGAAVCLGFVAGIIFFYRWFWYAVSHLDAYDDRPMARAAVGAVSSLVSFFLGGIGVLGLIDAPKWVAAFGYPELLIATKALEAAGLM